MSQNALKSILSFYSDSGVDTLTVEEAGMYNTTSSVVPHAMPEVQSGAHNLRESGAAHPQFTPQQNQITPTAQTQISNAISLDHVTTLKDLKTAILNYDGISIKKTAMNMVFADGDPESDIMIIGEAPETEEDRNGLPFMGESGQLLDKMLAAINLARKPQDGQKSCYICNVLNWRPPGNRSATPEEIELSLPFIKKHIDIVKPKIIVLMGAVSAKSVLERSEGISRLRGKLWDHNDTVKAVATYHPSFLMQQPRMKRKAWADLLMVQEYLDQE